LPNWTDWDDGIPYVAAKNIAWGEPIEKIRLPADHWYYKGQNMTTAKDIPAELVERMIELINVWAESADKAALYGGYAWRDKAREIVAALPKPVDPEKEAVRKIMEPLGYTPHSDESGWWTTQGSTFCVGLACFRAGRQFERDNS